MTIFEALILGLVQGVTEFLPISSSGHLVIVQKSFGFTESLLSFTIFIHLATLLAILIYFGRGLFTVTRKEWMLVAVGTLPAVAVGLLFKDQIETLFATDGFIGMELIISGLINFYIDYKLKKATTPVPTAAEQKEAAVIGKLSPLSAFGIGLAQAVAIIPAISRSGSTVAAGLASGMNRDAAFKYAFLLAIPALAGAGVLQFKDLFTGGSVPGIEVVPFMVGGAAALVSGILSLKLFKYVITQAQFKWFGWYCVILGTALTISSLG